MIWANLLHLSFNMWGDREDPEYKPDEGMYYKRCLLFEQEMWEEVLGRMAEAGMNMVVIDLGDAVKYESHPEIAVDGAWTPGKLRRELRKARRLGLEPIPKLNFSACHDAWLGPYSRMLSTDTYYGVCSDLIAEVSELFDTPRFFHLGMDEENAFYQRFWEYVVVRQFDLWWHDLFFLVEQVEKAGARAWVWSDYVWDDPGVFLARMPTSVLQSNWTYGMQFRRNNKVIRAYHDLETYGYDQIPTGSSAEVAAENFQRVVSYCRRYISPERLLGFLQTTWKPTVTAHRDKHITAIDCVAAARRAEERRR
jgi:hypothetical protein